MSIFKKIFKQKKILVTHNESFHADDLFASAVLSILYDGKIKIIRTRDPKIMSLADVVYDVGGIYDPETNHFDHHQKEGAGQRENGIPYASFGLVWKKYGEQICGGKEIAERIDKKIVQTIDAIDNGIDISRFIFENVLSCGADQVFLDNIPTWKEKNKDIDTIFLKQIKNVTKFLQREINVAKDDEEGSNIILDSYNKSEDKRLVILDINFPRYLFQSTLSNLPDPLYLIYPNSDNSSWKVEAITKSPNTIENRKLLPSEWRGFTNGDGGLKNITGVSDVIFCHRSGFLITAKSKESAIALAQKALIA